MPPVLVTILHDPRGDTLPAAEQLLPRIRRLYGRIFAVATQQSSQALQQTLAMNNVEVTYSEAGAVGRSRRDTVRLGYEAGAACIHYCDFDRILHWMATYPDELEGLLPRLADTPFTCIGRTPRAFVTHPACQIEPERLTNQAISHWLGQEIDVTAGSCALTRNAAEQVLELSIEESAATDCEWPGICHMAGLAIGSIATEGLEWETPDYVRQEITAAGSYEAWLRMHDADITRWQRRTTLALESINALVRLQRSA